MDIGGTVFENIIGVNKVSGTGKADLAFVSLKDRKLEVCWVSHKKGSKQVISVMGWRDKTVQHKHHSQSLLIICTKLLVEIRSGTLPRWVPQY